MLSFILSLLIEYSLIILRSIFFCAILSAVIFLIARFILKNKNKIIDKLLIFSGSIILTQILGNIFWRLFIENKLVKEADLWMTFLTFRPLSWQSVFEGVNITFYEPLAPLQTIGDVANLYNGLVIIFIIISCLLPFLLFRKKYKELLNYGVLFFILQIAYFGIISVIYSLI